MDWFRTIFRTSPTIPEVIYLAVLLPTAANAPGLTGADGEDSLSRIYEWRQARVAAIVNTMLGAATSFLVAVGAALVTQNFRVDSWKVLSAFGIAASLALLALIIRTGAKRIDRELVVALEWYRTIRRVFG